MRDTAPLTTTRASTSHPWIPQLSTCNVGYFHVELADRGTNFSLKDHPEPLHEKRFVKIQPQNIVRMHCNCGIKHMTVLADGTVYACRRFESPVGNALEQTFEDIFLGERMDTYRQMTIAGCNACELLHYCRGCHAVSFGTSEIPFRHRSTMLKDVKI